MATSGARDHCNPAIEVEFLDFVGQPASISSRSVVDSLSVSLSAEVDDLHRRRPREISLQDLSATTSGWLVAPTSKQPGPPGITDAARLRLRTRLALRRPRAQEPPAPLSASRKVFGIEANSVYLPDPGFHFQR